MKTILVPENADDLMVIEDIIQQSCDCEDGIKKSNTSQEVVILRPNVEKDSFGDWSKWTVIDNRDHQCFTEDFSTLDGAMIYATDLRTTCEDQGEWDVDGMFMKELSDQIKMAPSESEKLEDLVLKFNDADKDVAKDGWDGGKREGEWEAAKEKMVSTAVRMKESQQEQKKKFVPVRDILCTIMGNVELEVSSRVRGRNGSEAFYWKCRSRKGGKELVDKIEQSKLVDTSFLDRRARVSSCSDDDERRTVVSVSVEEEDV